jgi:very-short-patch-repair endonuclease
MKRAFAKGLRSQMTDAEQRLWYRLRARRFLDLKFKRQAQIGPYVVDFVCLEYRLIVEVDGGQHAENAADRKRDAWLTSEGYCVLRFWDDDVLKRTDVVLGEIARAVTLRQERGAPRRARAAPPPPPTRSTTRTPGKNTTKQKKKRHNPTNS